MATKKKAPPKVTSAADLKNYTKGAVVYLPDFGPEQPFVARMRRPSLMAMMNNGEIDDTLLAAANSLFNGTHSKELLTNPKLYSETYSVWRKVAERALIEPTLAELDENDVQLSDDQLSAIFAYSQEGVSALAQFHPNEEDSEGAESGDEDEKAAK